MSEMRRAFPIMGMVGDRILDLLDSGMSLREYAAIKLKVPSSGTDWLDDMICESRSRDLFEKLAITEKEFPIKDCDINHLGLRYAEIADGLLVGWYDYPNYLLRDGKAVPREEVEE
jgi:hypothetical protein